MRENVEAYLATWRNFTADILEEPEKNFLSFKQDLKSTNIRKFEKFFADVEKAYAQGITLDKVILLFLATSLATYYYETKQEEPNNSRKQSSFMQKMRNFHELLCLDNTLSDENKARLSALAGYGSIAISQLFLAVTFYDHAIAFQKKVLNADSANYLREYYFKLSLAYFKQGCKVHKQPAPQEEAKMYNKAIKAAKKGLAQETDYKKNEGWFYVSRATYSLAVLYYQQKKWNDVTQLLSKLILACSSGLEIHTNSQEQIGIFLGYISNSLELIPALLKQNIVEKESKQAIKESLSILKAGLLDLPQAQETVLLSIKEKIYQIESSMIDVENLNSYSTHFWSSHPTIQAKPVNETKATDKHPLKPVTNFV